MTLDKTAKDSTPMATASCAHLNVLYKPISHANGTSSDAWKCRDCGHPFWPQGIGKPLGAKEYMENYFIPCKEFLQRNGYADWDGQRTITLSDCANLLALFHMEMYAPRTEAIAEGLKSGKLGEKA